MTSMNTFDDQSDIVSDVHSFHRPSTNPPRCIHQVSSPSLLFSGNPQLPLSPGRPSVASTPPIERDHPNTQSHRSIRTTGFIQPVDEEAELASFERSRSISLSTSSRDAHNYSEQSASQKAAKILAVHEQYTRTVYLLNERARLLTQLADFKNS